MNDFDAEDAPAGIWARQAMCRAALDALVGTDSGVRAATVSTADGIEVASAGNIAEATIGKLAAITSSLQALGIAASDELSIGLLESVAIESSAGRMLCIEIVLQDTSLILAAVAAKKALLAMSLLAVRRCAKTIAAGWAGRPSTPE